MPLKKSFDYFKTLKEMSFSVCSSYKKMTKSEDFNSDVIRFSGLKWELSNNLLNDFVAPLERNDIYNLALLLNNELYYVSKLSNFFSSAIFCEFNFVESITSVLEKQTHIFNLINDAKKRHKIFKDINEIKAMLNGVNTSIILSLKSSFNNNNNLFLKSTIINCFFDVYKSIDDTFSEIQKVIINNN